MGKISLGSLVGMDIWPGPHLCSALHSIRGIGQASNLCPPMLEKHRAHWSSSECLKTSMLAVCIRQQTQELSDSFVAPNARGLRLASWITNCVCLMQTQSHQPPWKQCCRNQSGLFQKELEQELQCVPGELPILTLWSVSEAISNHGPKAESHR